MSKILAPCHACTQRVNVFIDRDQSTGRTEPGGYLSAVSAAACRAVDIDAVALNAEAVYRFSEQY